MAEANPTGPVASSSRTRDATYSEAISSFDLKESLGDRFARVPCQRKALIFGGAGGFGVFALRFFMTRRFQTAGNWAVPSFVLLSALSYQSCTSQRHQQDLFARQIVDKIEQVNFERRKKGLPPVQGVEYTLGTGEEGVGGERRREPREPRVVSRARPGSSENPLSPEQEWRLRTEGEADAPATKPEAKSERPRKKWFGIW